ncbi:MAG TPA: GDSL-type esterase/lipase family protein [Myxococcota bacterium]|nr:GDSL-type esterase/lipase family protein [Myxococcota bacterium]
MKRVFTGMGVALALLGLLEGASRLWPPPDPRFPLGEGGEEDILLKGNPWLLWELQPGSHRERGVTVHVNSMGMRGPERGPPSRPRALVVGDSSVYGFGVEDTEVFSALLEEKLPADFVNLAVPGYSSLQSLNLLKMRGLALEPDLLVVANLWSDNNYDSFQDAELLASWSGWEQRPAARIRDLLGKSSLFRWMDWGLRVAPSGRRAQKGGWTVGGIDPKIGLRRVPLENYVAALDALAASLDGRVLFLVLPNREDLEPRTNPAWTVYRQAMRAVATAWKAPVVEGPALFAASGRSADALFLDEMHPTALGHRLLAEGVAAALGSWPGQAWPVQKRTGTLPTLEDSGAQEGSRRRPGVYGRLVAPPFVRGKILVELSLPQPGGPKALGSVSLSGPGDWTIPVQPLPPRGFFRIYLDEAGDGPTEGDALYSWEAPIAADGRVDLDLSGRSPR